ncbi:MAG: lasso peptide biosynthesis B2 protein [Roseateles sp.]|uniref:lasso peptide biosynthesis B2 protein n=1 Tax=Roseateles sp. TaxID=1971397 RepID=UPI0040358B37
MSTTSATQPEYRLADHVRACLVDGQVILIDLQNDKYIGAGGPLASALSANIADWPAGDQGPIHTQRDGVDRWIGNLHQQGLLVPASQPASVAQVLATPLDSLPLSELAPLPRVPWRRFSRLAYASALTAHWLKRHSLATIARKVRDLRPVLTAQGHADPTADLPQASALYLRMRPLVITSHDKCLHDSLTLLRFLAAERLFPSWVIGVRTRPFAAHSWVQSGNLVLNDTHEYVRAFTPILIV